MLTPVFPVIYNNRSRPFTTFPRLLVVRSPSAAVKAAAVASKTVRIRRAFIADRGNVLISADYSQIELRVLAHLAEDEALIQAFQTGEDIHDRTAERVFGSSSGLDRYELRRRAKIINYALL